MSEIELKPCPKCKGEIALYYVCNPNVLYVAMAKCKDCKQEYPLPEVKLRVWKSNPLRISQKMVRDAERAWNRRYANEETE